VNWGWLLVRVAIGLTILATLFLGLCLIDTHDPYIQNKRALLVFIRAVVFFVTMAIIWFGA